MLEKSRLALLVAVVAAVVVACGGTPPPPARGVIESNVGAWKFRRYQQILDVEVYVRKNKAVAHTASYAYGEAEKAGRLGIKDVVNAFVTRYETDRGVVRAVLVFARRLAQEGGYHVEERSVDGNRVLSVSGNGEAWALWAANRHVVKVGGRGLESVPKKLIEAYVHRYPSRVPSGALEGPLPPDDIPPDKRDDGQEYDPDNPTPDWDEYESGKKQESDDSE
jgi:hypothetical protein